MVLRSHRGYDLGALPLAEHLASILAATLHATTVTRLLIDANRSLHHRHLFSEWSRGLPQQAKQQVIDTCWQPHRQRLTDAIEATLAAGEVALHIAVHSFTAELDGVRRDADIGLLYDPQRHRETRFAATWATTLRQLDPTLRVRRNYPYRGVADGLPTALRRRYPDTDYLGFELEVNQVRLAGRRAQTRRIHAVIANSLSQQLRLSLSP